MSEVVAAFLVTFMVGAFLFKIFQFWNITYHQCKEFGNCPWYLRWLK